MLFWLFVILGVVGVVISIKYEFEIGLSTIGAIIGFICSIAVVISLICIAVDYTTVDATIEKYNVRYETLCYKMESENIRDEFGLLNKEIIDDIQGWNEDIVFKQKIQDNFWVGIYYPNIYNQFKAIPLK